MEFISLEIETAGTVDRQDRITRFTDIGLRAVLTIPAGVEPGRATAVLEKAKSACLVSASLSVPIRLDTEIREAAAPAWVQKAS
jgi:hypothetical protein